MPGSPHIERREIDKDAAVLSAQLTGFVEQIANEPNTGLGHVRKNVAKLQDTVLEPGKLDLLTVLQKTREMQLDLESISGLRIGAAEIESSADANSAKIKIKTPGPNAALDNAIVSAHSLIEQIKKAKQSRAEAIRDARPDLNSLLSNNAEKQTTEENDFSQWYGKLFDSPQKDHVTE